MGKRKSICFYTPEQREFIKNNYERLSHKELTKLFNQEFRCEKSVMTIKAFCLRNGWKNNTHARFYTPEQKEFIKNNHALMSYKGLAKLFNKEFGCEKSAMAIRAFCLKNGFESNTYFYTSEQKEFIKNNYAGVSYKELAKLFNKEFGCEKTVMTIRAFCLKNGWESNTHARFYTPEQKEFIKNNYKGVSYKELAKLFNKEFGCERTTKNIKDFCLKHRLKNNRTHKYTEIHVSWLREHVPGKRWKEVVHLFNSKFNRNDSLHEIQQHCMLNKIYNSMKGGKLFHKNGHITHVTGGYARIKIDGKWYNLNRIIWEKNYGKLSEDNLVIFCDGNKDNCSINNLISVSRAEACIMNRKNLLFSTPEHTKTGVLIAKLLIKIKERQREIIDAE